MKAFTVPILLFIHRSDYKQDNLLLYTMMQSLFIDHLNSFTWLVQRIKFQTMYLIFFMSTTNWYLPVNYKLALAKSTARDWTTATRASALCCCTCWPSTRSEGNSGWRVRHSGLHGSWWNRSLDSYIFQELISWSQSLHLFISRKSLNRFMVTSSCD